MGRLTVSVSFLVFLLLDGSFAKAAQARATEGMTAYLEMSSERPADAPAQSNVPETPIPSAGSQQDQEADDSGGDRLKTGSEFCFDNWNAVDAGWLIDISSFGL